MRAVDTNVLVRLFTRDDERQVAAADAFIERGAWVSHLVLAEMVWVLGSSYHRDHSDIANTVDMLLRHKSLVVEDEDVVVAALEQYRSRPSLGFTDCLVLEIARKAGHVPLGTFDKELSKIDGAVRLGR